MNWNNTLRQLHRWLSIAFTLGVITYVAVMSLGKPPVWLGLFPLAPLILLLVSGLYMFVLPYLMRRRPHRSAGQVSEGRRQIS